jgi:hypothetical protein
MGWWLSELQRKNGHFEVWFGARVERRGVGKVAKELVVAVWFTSPAHVVNPL